MDADHAGTAAELLAPAFSVVCAGTGTLAGAAVLLPPLPALAFRPHPACAGLQPQPCRSTVWETQKLLTLLPLMLPRHPQACNRNTIYCVPLYDVLGDNTVEYIIEHSGERLLLYGPQL